MVAPVLEKIGREHTDFEIVKVNVDENQDLAMKYGVMSIPTMIVFKEGKAINGMVGFSEEKAIIDLITKN
jgi:thioredoxin 1